MELLFQKYTLDFKFDAGTSRGILRQKDTYILKITGSGYDGLGEAGPLKGLSVDDRDLEPKLKTIQDEIRYVDLPETEEEIFSLAYQLAGDAFPSIRFGLETAMLDALHEGKRLIFNNAFAKGEIEIPINGLIWMGHMEDMLLQITEKIEKGFECIKMKVGSLDFDKECDILQYIRRKYYQKEILVRVDANGAFNAGDAMSKLDRLSTYAIHSIEQPIKAGQPDQMARLCAESPVPVALDEELIGITGMAAKRSLLETIKPPYIIVKPTLLGGIQATREWIELAEEMNIGWWFTSALESNIGLNAISQFAGEMKISGFQGLGTGQLYHNNIESPLVIKQGHIAIHPKPWDLSPLSL